MKPKTGAQAEMGPEAQLEAAVQTLMPRNVTAAPEVPNDFVTESNDGAVTVTPEYDAQLEINKQRHRTEAAARQAGRASLGQSSPDQTSSVPRPIVIPDYLLQLQENIQRHLAARKTAQIATQTSRPQPTRSGPTEAEIRQGQLRSDANERARQASGSYRGGRGR